MFSTQTARMIDDDHRSNLELLGRVEKAVSRAAYTNEALVALLREFAHAMEHEIGRHFQFEEDYLFPRIADAGDGAIAALMLDEHAAIREVAAELLPLVNEVAAGQVDEEAWDRMRLGTLELIERQVFHIQKETMAVLPLLDDVLDPETDGELAMGYAAA